MSDEKQVDVVPEESVARGLNRRKLQRAEPGRPVNAKAEDAYVAWALAPNKQRGALVKLSQDLGVPVATISYWKQHYRWEERWVHDLQGARQRLVQEGEATLLAALRPAMERLGRIAVHGSDRDAVNAVKVFAAILGMDQSKRGINLHLTTINPVLIDEAKERSKGEMKKVLAEFAQANIEAAQTIKRRPGS